MPVELVDGFKAISVDEHRAVGAIRCPPYTEEPHVIGEELSVVVWNPSTGVVLIYGAARVGGDHVACVYEV